MTPDLHTHTTASDGSLAPLALIERAADCGVTHLSITDHDTMAGYAGLPPPDELPLVLVPGIELSAVWRTTGVHVVGLGVDPADESLALRVIEQRERRLERARRIADRLARRGVAVPLGEILEEAGDGMVGRPNFAASLVRHGHVRDVAAAFRRYLGNGKAGDVRTEWPPMRDAVAWIRAAGGIPVLAHPARYGLTWQRLRALVHSFREAGGRAIEVVSGHQDALTTARLASIADDARLAASCGSDFHSPGRPWADLGRHAALPPGVRPVWELWA